MRQTFHSGGMRYRLLRAGADDQLWLDRLRRDVYRELFLATFGSWDEARHVRHSTECWDRGDISLIEVEGLRVGMLQLLDEPGFVEIAEFQIQPSHQSRGIGSRILNDILKQAHKRGKSVKLSVALKNERAFWFYHRHGFRQVAQTETHNQMQCAP